MGARRRALVAKLNDAANLVEGEPRGLGSSDELQAVSIDLGVDAVSVARSQRWGKQATSFVIADRARRQPALFREIPDSHLRRVALDLIL